jgi:hypothetical protein
MTAPLVTQRKSIRGCRRRLQVADATHNLTRPRGDTDWAPDPTGRIDALDEGKSAFGSDPMTHQTDRGRI